MSSMHMVMDADALVAERIALSPSKGIKAKMAAGIDGYYPLADVFDGDPALVEQGPQDEESPVR